MDTEESATMGVLTETKILILVIKKEKIIIIIIKVWTVGSSNFYLSIISYEFRLLTIALPLLYTHTHTHYAHKQTVTNWTEQWICHMRKGVVLK